MGSFEIEPDEMRRMTGSAVGAYALEQGGVSAMLRRGDQEEIDRISEVLRPHITAKDIERARRISEIINRIVEETGRPFDEIQILVLEQLERLSSEGE